MKLGAKVRDKITGFEGIVTGIVNYISGCNQALLAPPVDKEGKRRDAEWFDIQRLEAVDGSLIVLENAGMPGCDSPAPVR